MFSSRAFSYLDLSCRLLLAGVFIFAGIPKILDPETFALTINAYGMLPEQLVYPVAIFLPYFEVLVAVGLLMNKRIALWATLVLLIFFIIVLGYAMYLGLDIDCGCFGADDPEAKAFSSIRTAFWRDILFLCVLSFPFWQCYSNKSCI